MRPASLAIGTYRHEDTEALFDGSVTIKGFDADVKNDDVYDFIIEIAEVD